MLLVIGLFILKVDFVLLVAFLIAFLDMLPFFGTGTVLWPWAAIKILSGDYQIAIGLMILYAVTQIVRQVIQPKIVGDTIGMNPLATLIFMYIGYKVSSIAGMIIAVPLGMILINLYQASAFEEPQTADIQPADQSALPKGRRPCALTTSDRAPQTVSAQKGIKRYVQPSHCHHHHGGRQGYDRRAVPGKGP